MVMKTNAPKLAEPQTRTISAAEFKAKCLQLMDEVSRSNLTLVVTKRGKPVAQLSAAAGAEKPFRSIVGRSPCVKVPSPAEWKRLKTEWAGDWSDRDENLRDREEAAAVRKRRA